MTRQLDDRIRDLMQQVVDESPDPPTVPLESDVRGPQRSRQWMVALAAAALVLLMVGGVAWLISDTDTDIVDQPPTTPTTLVPEVTTPTTAPLVSTTMEPTTTRPEPRQWIWERVVGDNGLGRSAIWALAETSSGLVAVGTGTEGGGEGVVFFSDDGLSWNQAASFGGDIALWDVAVSDWGVVVVGSERFTSHQDRARVWAYDEQSLSWMSADDESLRDPVWAEVFAVGADGSQVVIGGRTATPTVWLTDDGRSWTRVDLGDDVGRVNDVVRFGDRWVAVGAVGRVDESRVAIWVADDWLEWAGVVDEAVDTTFHIGPRRGIGRAAVSEDLIVVIGDPWVWTSRDGLSWDRFWLTDAVGVQDIKFDDIAEHEGVFYVVGYDSSTAYMWESRDGQTWTRISDAELFAEFGFMGWAITAGERGLVALGPAFEGVVILKGTLD